MIRLLSLSALLLAGVIALQVYMRIFVVTLLLFIPVGLWISYLLFRVQVYYKEFKPRIVGLILDFIDNNVNYSELQYDHEACIPPDTFLASGIFTAADDYSGEDLITGKVRETPFALSELRVSEFSDVRSKLDRVFHGIFLTADFHNLHLNGSVLLLPDDNMKYLTRSEKAIHLLGGRRQHQKLLPEFEAFFNTYATPDVRLSDVLSPEFQREILAFRQHFQQLNRKKEIYLSLMGDDIFIALTQDRDLLEPSIWYSNADFDMIREFYDDIALLLDLVLRIDVMN